MKCLESWKNAFFLNVQKLWNHEKVKSVKFSPKSEQKQFFTNFSIIWRIGYIHVFVRDFVPTLFTGASTLRPWMKDNRLKLMSTDSRVLLFLNQVWFRHFFSQISVFYDANLFLTFYPLWKRILFEIFPSPKKCQLSKPITFFVRVENWFFSQTSFTMILNIFWTFYPFWRFFSISKFSLISTFEAQNFFGRVDNIFFCLKPLFFNSNHCEEK